MNSSNHLSRPSRAARRFRLVSALPLALALAAGLVAMAGCKPKYPECKKDKHCKVDADEKCVDGTCQNCTTNADCAAKGPNGEDWVCHEMRCADPATVPAGAGLGGGMGSPCASTLDCSEGYVCKAGKCDMCLDDSDCAASGGTCNFDTGRCQSGAGGGAACQTDDQCPQDEICDGGSCVFSGAYGDSTAVLCDLDAVYFGFDSPQLSPETEAKLTAAAECIKSQGKQVILEAHADPRGTEEYNILLTDRRGQSVKTFLEALGVSQDSMQVISKGSLEASGSDEASWQKDRRVQFIWP
jgi:peptidoglycan-associated lipoprotein